MGLTAENVAEKYSIDREDQDRFALLSHQKSSLAHNNGNFKAEICSVFSEEEVVSEDGCIRHDSNLESIGKLKPVFQKI